MAGYMTRQRRLLLNYLNAHPDELLSPREIARALEADNMSLSAVYRNLAHLEAERQVQRVTRSGSREALYRYAQADDCQGHLHLSCEKCGRTFHMQGEETEQLVEAVARAEGFALDKTGTVLYGVCAECRENPANGA